MHACFVIWTYDMASFVGADHLHCRGLQAAGTHTKRCHTYMHAGIHPSVSIWQLVYLYMASCTHTHRHTDMHKHVSIHHPPQANLTPSHASVPPTPTFTNDRCSSLYHYYLYGSQYLDLFSTYERTY